MRSFKLLFVTTVVVFVWMLMSATYKPVSAGQAEQVNPALKKVEPKKNPAIAPGPSKSRAVKKKMEFALKVLGPSSGRVMLKNRYEFCLASWQYGGDNEEPLNAFRVKLMKNSDRSWSVDLGRNNNMYMEAHAYCRHWKIPADFTAGTDYFVRIIHIPSGVKSHSPYFTIE